MTDPHEEMVAKQNKGVGAHCIFSQRTNPWPGCGFKSKVTEIRVRRVIDDKRDELQMEISVIETRGESERLRETLTGIIFKPEHIAMLIDAIEMQNPLGEQ